MRKKSELLHGDWEKNLEKLKRKNIQNILWISSTFQNYSRNQWAEYKRNRRYIKIHENNWKMQWSISKMVAKTKETFIKNWKK
jgi:hypothetical protein